MYRMTNASWLPGVPTTPLSRPRGWAVLAMLCLPKGLLSDIKLNSTVLNWMVYPSNSSSATLFIQWANTPGFSLGFKLAQGKPLTHWEVSVFKFNCILYRVLCKNSRACIWSFSSLHQRATHPVSVLNILLRCMLHLLFWSLNTNSWGQRLWDICLFFLVANSTWKH